jgi:transposase InsO family protein
MILSSVSSQHRPPIVYGVADITYVPTSAGWVWVYTTFILDIFHREIVGWQVTNHMRESLARDALTMALAAKYRAGEDNGTAEGLVDSWVYAARATAFW